MKEILKRMKGLYSNCSGGNKTCQCTSALYISESVKETFKALSFPFLYIFGDRVMSFDPYQDKPFDLEKNIKQLKESQLHYDILFLGIVLFMLLTALVFGSVSTLFLSVFLLAFTGIMLVVMEGMGNKLCYAKSEEPVPTVTPYMRYCAVMNSKEKIVNEYLVKLDLEGRAITEFEVDQLYPYTEYLNKAVKDNFSDYYDCCYADCVHDYDLDSNDGKHYESDESESSFDKKEVKESNAKDATLNKIEGITNTAVALFLNENLDTSLTMVQIQEGTGLSKLKVRKAIKELKDSGFVTSKRTKNGSFYYVKN